MKREITLTPEMRRAGASLISEALSRPFPPDPDDLAGGVYIAMALLNQAQKRPATLLLPSVQKRKR